MKRSINGVLTCLMVAAVFCLMAIPVAWADEAPLVFSLGDEPTAVDLPSSEDAGEDDSLLSSEPAVANEPANESLEPGDNVYVNGETGDDSNPGTEAQPVKTFAKAKELMEKYGSDIIWVSGALDLSGTTETWDLDGKMMMREAEYTGELVHLSDGANLTLKNIVLDGGLGNGARGKSNGEGCGGSLVGVYSKSVLTIGADATLQNNAYQTSNGWYPEAGGGVYASNSTVNLEGGTITGNMATYGAGICADNHAVVNISSGLITGNTAVKGTDSALAKSYGGTGGGVCAWRGASVNFSGGTISNNAAYERGGGISIGSFYDFKTYGGSTLTMTGGTVDGNTAGSAGGGIFIQYGYSAQGSGGDPTYCIAKISAGTITNNQMTNDGDGNSSFGGGAIYINGISSAYKDWHSGELYLGNAVITGNSASAAGGGYAGCPASKTTVKLTNGAVFYGNSADSNSANELYVLASMGYGSHSGNPQYEVSASMLGGGAYRWLYDDGTEVPFNKLKGTLNMAKGEELCLNNNLKESDSDVQAAVAEATVFITGNRSETRGGAIGSNGTFILGSTEYPVEVSATKVWDDAGKEDQRPEEISFELYRDGVYVGYQTLKADDEGVWKTTFKNLPKTDVNGNEYVYTVKERAIEGYDSTVAGDAQNGFTITNTPETEKTTVGVIKKWVGDDENARPASITVELLKNGEVIDTATIEPDEDGEWKHEFSGLEKYENGKLIEYTVREAEVPAGYTSEVSGDMESGFVITNTPDEPENPEEPDEPDNPDEPDEPATPEHPYAKTGAQAPDNNLGLILLVAAGIAAAGAAFVFASRRFGGVSGAISGAAHARVHAQSGKGKRGE